MDKIKNMKFIGPNARVLGPWIFLFVVLVILFVVFLRFGYSQISTRLADIRGERAMESILKEKIEVLKEVDSDLLPDTSKLLIALPDRNMASWVISELKSNALDHSISLNYLELNNQQNENDIVVMNLLLEGASRTYILEDIVSFLVSIEDIAPLVFAREIDIVTEQNDGIIFEAQLVIFWSPLPTQLPPLTDPIKELTAQQNELLSKVTSLKYPTLTHLAPTNPGLRENPFIESQ